MKRIGLAACLLVACRRPPPPQTHDAASADAAIVDTMPDAGDGPITVTAFTFADSTQPLVGAMVEFVAPGRTQTVMTDANGVASAISPPGTTVIIFQDGSGGHPLVKVFANAMPGDSIRAGALPAQAFPRLGDITFAPPTVTAAAGYQVDVSCQVAVVPGVLTMHVVDCPTAHDATAVAWAVDNAGTAISGPSTLAHLDLASLVGTTVTMPAYAGTPATITGVFSNIPASSIGVEWEASYFLANDAAITAFEASSPPSPQMQLAAVGDHTRTSLFLQPPASDPLRCDQVSAGLLGQVAVDAASGLTSLYGINFDLGREKIKWTESTPRTPPTIVDAIVVVTTNGQPKVEIHVHAPYDASGLTLPQLPSALMPTVGDQVLVQATFQTVVGASYDALIQTIDSYPGFMPINDPSFVGTVWSEQ